MSPRLSPQINHFSKSRDRAILVTDQHLYKLDPRKQYRVMRALPLSTVSVPRPTSVPYTLSRRATVRGTQMSWLSCSHLEAEDPSMVPMAPSASGR